MIYTNIKRVVALLLAVVLILTAVGCENTKNYEAVELSEEILKRATFSEMKELSGASLSTYFNFGDGNVKRFSVRISATAESADTLACFEVKNDEQRSTVIEGISNYLSKLSYSFEETMEKEYQKIENRVLVQLEDVIILVICSDTAPVWDYLTELGAKEVI